MYIIPNIKKCLEKNGEFSEEKYNIEFNKLFEIMKKSNNEIEITPEMLEIPENSCGKTSSLRNKLKKVAKALDFF